jgi:hypothetical protein
VANKHGLPRDIPADVKRAVRQRDGFGCIRCGSAVYTYEHVDPTFEEAKSHDAATITLLCAGCHDLVTRGILSKDTVKGLMATPKCREAGFSFGPLDVGESFPTVQIGPVTLERVGVVVRAAGDDVLRIDPPEQAGAPYRISARLTNQSGDETLTIVENEWRSSAGNWDVEVVGPRITIHDAPREIALVIRTDPPQRLVVERLKMYHRGVEINASETDLTVSAGARTTFKAYSAHFADNTVGIDVDSAGGARMGVGGGSVYIGHMVTGGGSTNRPVQALPGVSDRRRAGPPAQPTNPPFRRTSPKHGRNSLCTCGSGQKYKYCCGRAPST